MNIASSEWKIMKLLWERPRTIMQITKELQNETNWAKNTIITMLKRMEKKGIVYYIEDGKAKVFYANCSKEDAMMEESEEFLHKVFEGNVPMLLNTFVKKEKLNETDIDEICKLLNLKR